MNIYLTILILVISLTCYSQETRFQVNENLDIVLKTDSVTFDTNKIYLMRMDIVNNSDLSYLFWFSEISTSGMTQEELIRHHFYKTKGDFNLIQLATETITEDTKLPKSSFAVFTKLINQHKTYTYNIIVRDQITTDISDSIQGLIMNHLVLMPEKITRGFFDIKTIEKIMQKGNSSFMEWNVLKSNVLN